MEPVEPQTTEVIEEKPELLRTRKNLRVFAGLGGLLVVVMLVVLVLSMQRAKKKATSMLSVDDLTQQKYDLQEREREKNKASQLRDDPLLLRKDSESETESRLEGLLNQIEKKSGPLAESPDDSQARQEEEMIAHVMRSTSSAATGPAPSVSYQPTAPVRTGSAAEGDLRASDRPMFVYSHTFGGARYVEAARKDNSATGSIKQNEAQTKPPGPPVSNPEARTGQRQPTADKNRNEKTAIIYNEYPPVTLYEGEMRPCSPFTIRPGLSRFAAANCGHCLTMRFGDCWGRFENAAAHPGVRGCG
jgi:hypothetical protein